MGLKSVACAHSLSANDVRPLRQPAGWRQSTVFLGCQEKLNITKQSYGAADK